MESRFPLYALTGWLIIVEFPLGRVEEEATRRLSIFHDSS